MGDEDFGRPRRTPGTMKPGENATMRPNKSPLVSPIDRAYEAPSLKPWTETRAGSTAKAWKTLASASSRKATSSPYEPRMTSHVAPRASTPSSSTPSSSADATNGPTPARPSPPAPWNLTENGAGTSGR
jgi:hypothetical protein